MAKNPFRERGFKSYREESARKDAIYEQKKGKLFRFFLTDKDEDDVEIRFLNDEPILFYEHSVNEGGKFLNVTCTGDDCPYCEGGNKAAYKGAFLIVDTREFEMDERDAKGDKTGKKKKVKDRLKILARGTKDLAKLDRINTKYGLKARPYAVTRIGSGNTTSYEFDRMDKDPITSKQIEKFLSTLPEKYKGMDVFEVIEANLFGMEEEEKSPVKRGNKGTRRRSEEEDEIEDVDSDVIEVEDTKPKTVKKKLNIVKKKK